MLSGWAIGGLQEDCWKITPLSIFEIMACNFSNETRSRVSENFGALAQGELKNSRADLGLVCLIGFLPQLANKLPCFDTSKRPDTLVRGGSCGKKADEENQGSRLRIKFLRQRRRCVLYGGGI